MSRGRHRLRVLEAAAFLALAGLMLRLMPLPALLRLGGLRLDPAPPAGGLNPAPLARAVDAAVTAAARRLPWHPVCLPQAIAAGLMVRRRGGAPQLCFGIRKSAAGLDAHAWLTLDGGIVCGGRMDPGLAPFRPPAAPARPLHE